MSEETKAAFESMRFYKFYPVQSLDAHGLFKGVSLTDKLRDWVPLIHQCFFNILHSLYLLFIKIKIKGGYPMLLTI